MGGGTRALDLPRLFEVAATASPVEAIDAMADELADMLGARSARFLVCDLMGRALARFAGTHANAARDQQDGADHAPTVDLVGTVYETVLRDDSPDVAALADGTARLVVPVTDRGDRLGVLELDLPWQPDADDVAEIGAAARALAHVVVTSRRHTDLVEWAQRSTPFVLAAEIQRRLLPSSYTCETDQFTLAGWLEPAAAVGGDTFDYALDRDTLHVSITDAVGHDVTAALLATVLVSSLRNSRRHGLGLGEQVRRANDALAAHSTAGEFVTGQVLRIDRRTGTVDVVNAGHPAPRLLRDGRVQEIGLAVDMPFGIEAGREFRLQRFTMARGDRLLLLTDGLLERNAASLDIAGIMERTATAHPHDAVVAVCEEVLVATAHNLRDDATVVCLDWHGGDDDPALTADDPAART